MPTIIVDLSIPRDEWLKIYRGVTKIVYARSRDGRSIQFPCNILSNYTTHSGVHGSFAIEFDAQGKFQHIHPI
jgi:hypothetical protein